MSSYREELAQAQERKARKGKKMVTFWVDPSLCAEWYEAARENFQTFTDFAILAIGDAVEEYRERSPEERRKDRHAQDSASV